MRTCHGFGLLRFANNHKTVRGNAIAPLVIERYATKMKTQRIWKLLCCFLLMSAVVCAAVAPVAGQSTPIKESNAQSVAAFNMTKTPTISAFPFARTGKPCPSLPTDGLPSTESFQDLYLYPGGMPFVYCITFFCFRQGLF